MKRITCIFLLAFLAVPEDGATAQVMSGKNANLKTRVCTAEVLSFTDWRSCVLEAPATVSAPDRTVCEARTVLCVQGCDRQDNPATCKLQCSARSSICIAGVR